MSKLVVLVGPDVGQGTTDWLRTQFSDVDFVEGLTPADMLAHAPRAHVIFTKNLPGAVLGVASRLRWVQAGIAGVDGMLANGMKEHPAILTNARGAHGIPMAEHILAMMFAQANRLPLLVTAQQERRRAREQAVREKWELDGQTIGVVGLGDVGATLAHKSKALGLRVLGVRRSTQPFPGIDGVWPPSSLDEILPECDHVALCLPRTPETEQILDARRIASLKTTACVYNVGRGSAIDQEALTAALGNGRLAGAGLDVTTPEPLPDDSPLWSMPNVILGQHSSGHSPFNHERITRIFAANLARYVRGEPLENVVDKNRGY